MKRDSAMLAVLLCCVCGLAHGQNPSPAAVGRAAAAPRPVTSQLALKPAASSDSAALSPVTPSLGQLRAAVLAGASPHGGTALEVHPVHRALFCRFDDDLDRQGLPLRFRLGDLETVNRMEGKPGY